MYRISDIKIKLVCSIALLFLVSCATAPSKFSIYSTPDIYNLQNIPSGNSRLIFNRDNAFLYAIPDTRLEINENLVTKISNGGGYQIDIPSGPITISTYGAMDPGIFTIKLDVFEGKIYEFFIEPNTSNFAAGALLGIVGTLIEAGSETSGQFAITLKEVIAK